MRLVILSLALVTLLVACTTSSEALPDRLVILDQGNVITIDPDGANPESVADSAEGNFFQPIWSPDRSLIAFSLESEDPAIYMARMADDAVFSLPTTTFPFYYSWSDQNDLAILHNDTSGLRLDTTALDADSLTDLKLVETGQPLYYSWHPERSEFAAHIGSDRLVTSDLDESELIDLPPGVFPAPSWTERGILTLSAGDQRQDLLIVDRGQETINVATVDGPATFLPNHNASLIAVQSLGPEGNAQSASFQVTPRLPSNRLVVVDVDTGEFTTVTSAPVLAFFWSPVDDQLLVLDIVDGPQARWSVWTEAGSEELVRFTPEPRFVREFLPFFDQYAQSVSLWSPDGSAIAFPGAIGEQAGIWVQPVDGEAVFAHEGTWVAWAP
jgi:TolB protein